MGAQTCKGEPTAEYQKLRPRLLSSLPQSKEGRHVYLKKKQGTQGSLRPEATFCAHSQTARDVIAESGTYHLLLSKALEGTSFTNL